jgi:Flp pilus assembly protein TadG
VGTEVIAMTESPTHNEGSAATGAADGQVPSDRAKPGCWRQLRRDESGLALVWLSLFLLVLLGFAALAVDLGHGYLVAQDAQNAAALAGTIYLPGDLASAQGAAASVAAANGFTTANSTINAVQGAKPSQLTVTITQNVPTWFARALV